MVYPDYNWLILGDVRATHFQTSLCALLSMNLSKKVQKEFLWSMKVCKAGTISMYLVVEFFVLTSRKKSSAITCHIAGV